MRVYVCVTGDLFHYGHIRFFKKARGFGAKLIVGICSDDHVSAYKRRPILNLEERSEVIRTCILVDEVVIGAPPATDKKFMELYRIDTVVASTEYSEAILRKYYNYPQKIRSLKLVDYTAGISTTDIILGCHKAVTEEASQKKYLRKFPTLLNRSQTKRQPVEIRTPNNSEDNSYLLGRMRG